MDLIRVHPPGVEPLEVWDVHLSDDAAPSPLPSPNGRGNLAVGVEGRVRPLYEFTDEAARAFALPRAIAVLRSGAATAWSGRVFPIACREIAHVAIGGGGASAFLARAIEAAGLGCTILDGGAFAGGVGGARLVEATLGITSGAAVVDVGQTAIKVEAHGRRARFEHDRRLIPNVDDLDARDLAAVRARFIDWRASALSSIAPKPRALVLALPCEIADDGTLGGCTYPWRRGDRTLVPEVLARAHLGDVPCLLLNDAELAAASASLADGIPRDRTTLVLTIGMGIGGALLRPR